MKKSTIFLLVLIYIISILVVGFFGASIRPSNVYIYVDSIELVDPTGTKLNKIQSASETTFAFRTTYKEEGGGEPFSVSIQAIVKPDKANDKEVFYFYDEAQSDKYTVVPTSENPNIAVITFFAPGVARGSCQSTDGKKLTVNFVIIAQ